MSGLLHIPKQCQRVLDIICEQGHINCNTANTAGIRQFHARMFELKGKYGDDFFSKTRLNYTAEDGTPRYINDYKFAKAQGELAL